MRKIGEASGLGEESAEKEKELSEEELQKLLVIVPVEEVYVEALQIFAEMLKKFDRDDLVKLWDLVKERFSTTKPTDDKEKELWVELKRLFEPDNDDTLWKLQRYMHDPLNSNSTQDLLVKEKMESQSETTQTVSALKLPVLKTREYDLWSMRMEQYLTFTDHALWEVIVNGDSVSPVASASTGAEGPIPPKTAEQKLARKNELKAKSTLMLAIPDEHLLKFHACKDAKSLWEAIKNRFGGNKESKKMQKTILKQNYENFAASSQEGLDKTYDRAPRNQGNINRDAPRKNAPVDTSTTNALVVQDRIGGYDWSFQAKNGITKFSLMEYTSQGIHAVPPPYTGNYMPSRPNLSFAGLDDSVYKTKVGETETSISKTSKDIVEKPKTVRPSAPIIEEWDTDSDNDSVFRPKSDQTKSKFTKINFVKSGKNVKSVNKENTHRQVEYSRKSQSPRDNRRNWNGMMTQKLGNGFEFIKKACFVCGSLNNLIKDCNFHDNKMVENPVLNNKGRVTGQREIRPVWNNAQRVNHQNKLTHPHPKRICFRHTAVAISRRTKLPVNAA
ncbi:hypothetical protein Tco_0758765 [Tanacetum coccineum]